MSRVPVLLRRFHRTFTRDAAFRTPQRPTELSGRLLRVIAHCYNISSPQLLQQFIQSVKIRRLWAISSAGRIPKGDQIIMTPEALRSATNTHRAIIFQKMHAGD